MAKSPSHGRDMGALYLIFWLRNYPHDRGTRPADPSRPRRPQIGRKGVSNHRRMVGGKCCLLLNQWGLIVGWACATANVADNTFQWLVQQCDVIKSSAPLLNPDAGGTLHRPSCDHRSWGAVPSGVGD